MSERMEVQRTIAADPATIFTILCDPQGHVAIDSSGMLQDATGDPVAAVGDSFVVHMDREALNDYPMGRYDVTVTITAFEQDREIAWTILGQLRPPIGHVYGYTLEPTDEGTLVTSYYDWSTIDPHWREAGIFPVMSELALRATLGVLARTVARGIGPRFGVAADVLSSYRAIIDWVDPRVEGAGDLGAPTPCAGWDVGTLLVHIVGGLGFFTAMGRSGRVDPDDVELPEFSADAPIDCYRVAAGASVDAWSAPDALDQVCEMPFGPVPGRLALGIHAADLLIHGWDLAVASGQTADMGPELARFALDVEQQFVTDELRGPDGPFGAAIPTGDSASPQERLLAFVGRRSP